MKIGIDKIGFSTSNLYVDMAELAIARHEEPGKYLIGLGQSEMAVIPPTQDVVTLACNAAEQVLTPADKQAVGLVIFGTESGIDNSKAAAMYVADLLELPKNIRAFEIKQACCGATAGIAMAKGYLALNPGKKVLVLGADIARYGLKTSGEPTQGGGAVALLLSNEPAILAFEPDSSYLAENAMDFWRPLGMSEALVQGKYSGELYLKFFKTVFLDHLKKTGLSVTDFNALVFHLPYTKMGLKALRIALNDVSPEVAEHLKNQFESSREYNRNVGNLYTGSLYLSLLSLLHNSSDLAAGQRIGLFSYGSGAQGEFFSGILQPNFKDPVFTSDVLGALRKREKISVREYEKIYRSFCVGQREFSLDANNDHSSFVFVGTKEGKRQYVHQK